MSTDALRSEYEELLSSNGLSPQNYLPDPERRRVLEEKWHEALGLGGGDKDDIAELKSAVAEAVSQGGPANLIQRLAKEVAKDLSSMGAPVDACVYAAEYPTGDLNARIVRRKSGYLILINTGLLMTLHLIMKTMARAWSFADVRGGTLTPLLPPAIGVPEALNELLEIITAYFAGDTRLSTQRDFVTGKRLQMLSETTHFAEKFVVAHEYAHMIHGGVGEATPTMVLDSGAGRIDAVIPDHQKEYDADVMAVSILMASANWSDNRADAMKRICGPFLFLGVHDMLLRIGESLFQRPVRYSLIHPPTHERLRHLKEHVTTRYGAEMLGDAEQYLAWLKAYADFTITAFQEGAITFPEGSPYRVNPS